MNISLVQQIGRLMGFGFGPYSREQHRAIKDVMSKGKASYEEPTLTIHASSVSVRRK